MNDIIKIINDKISLHDDEVKRLSGIKNDIYDVYKLVYNKKSGVNIDKLVDLLDRPNTLKRCLNRVYITDDFTYEKAIKTISSYKDFLEYKKNIKKTEDKTNIRIYDKKYRDKMKMNILLSGHKELLENLNRLIEGDEKIKKTAQYCTEILNYFCDRVKSEYDFVYKKREELKKDLKKLRSALKKIDRKEKLNVEEVYAIISVIEDCVNENDLKSHLLDVFNKYILSIEKENNKLTFDKKETKQNVNKDKKNNDESNYDINSKYVFENDLVIEDKKEEDLFVYNYIKTLHSFETDSEKIDFLNSLKNLFDIKKLVSNMLSNISVNDELNYLLNSYLLSLSSEKSEIDKKEKDINVLYYDFIHDNNVILSDVKKISKEIYKDVLRVLSMIKDNVAKPNGIVSIPKVLKLKLNQIRVTYKRINSDTYIIFGIFYKDDNKGYNVINATKKRNKDFLNNEINIINDAFKNESIKESLLAKNEEYEKSIFNHLKSKVKN